MRKIERKICYQYLLDVADGCWWWQIREEDGLGKWSEATVAAVESSSFLSFKVRNTATLAKILGHIVLLILSHLPYVGGVGIGAFAANGFNGFTPGRIFGGGIIGGLLPIIGGAPEP